MENFLSQRFLMKPKPETSNSYRSQTMTPSAAKLKPSILAKKEGIRYITGVELNVTFSHPKFQEGKAVSLDFLGYQFDPENKALESKLETMAKYREERAAKILDNLNSEFQKEQIAALTKDDLRQD